MRKTVNYLSVLVFVGLVWIFGYKVGSGRLMDPQIYHANTVGSQIVQINEMYDKMDAAGMDVLEERLNYNRDILTVIDCSELLKSLSDMNPEDQRMKIFKDGVELAWRHANQSKKEIVFCGSGVLEWVSEMMREAKK